MNPILRYTAYTYRLFCFIFAIPFILLAKIPLHGWQFNYIGNAISFIPLLFWDFIRYRYYKYTISHLGKDVMILFGSVIQDREVSIGNNVTIGNYTMISGAHIWNDVLIWPYCIFMAGWKSHSYERRDIPMRLQHTSSLSKQITIWSDARFWTYSVIMSSVQKWSIIGAWSVVTKEIGEYKIAAWNPCRALKERPL